MPGSAAGKAEVIRLSARRAQVESLFTDKSPFILRRYARLGSPNEECAEPTDSIALVTGDWPDATAVSYAFGVDSSGRVVAAIETPTSCSGDWVLRYTYFFDTTGRTTMFERFSGFFNGCDFGIAHETSTYYYGASGALIEKTYALTDTAEQAQPPKRCEFMYRQPYTIHSSWRAYAKSAKLPLHP